MVALPGLANLRVCALRFPASPGDSTLKLIDLVKTTIDRCNHGSEQEGLEAFTNSWDHLLAGISVDRPDDNMLCALFYEQLCEFRCLELDMPLWDRDDSVRNYAHLRTICVNAITTCRRRRNQEKMYFATRRQGNCGMLPLLMAARVDRPHDLNEVPALVDDVTRGMADVPVSLFAETWRSSRQTHKKVGGKKQDSGPPATARAANPAWPPSRELGGTRVE